MAYELNIPASDQKAKVRNPWGFVGLTIITLGIYHLVWWYKVNKEMKAFGESRGYDLGRNPTNSLLALFPGGIIIVPALITYWHGTKRVQGAQRLAGREPVNGWIALVLYLFIGIAFPAYLQVGLNGVWRQELAAAPGQDIPPHTDDGPMPPKLADPPEARLAREDRFNSGRVGFEPAGRFFRHPLEVLDLDLALGEAPGRDGAAVDEGEGAEDAVGRDQLLVAG